MNNSGINAHKQMAMGKDCYKKGGSVKSNIGPPKVKSQLPPKSGFNEAPMEKVKRANGVKGV